MFPIKDTIPAERTPVVNWLIILVNLVVFLFELSLTDEELKTFFYGFALVPSKVNADTLGSARTMGLISFMPFFTNMFLHGGWGHFISNMWTLFIFGDNVEDKMGRTKYLIFYVLCGITASTTHYFLNIDSTVPALGASGAISGIMAAYMFLFPTSSIIFLIPVFFIPLFVPISAFIYIAIWFIGQLMSGTFHLVSGSGATGIAFWAHIGGFVGGLLLHRLFVIKKRLKKGYR